MPKMYVKKNGKDNLVVSGLDIVFDVIGSAPPTQIKFTCPGFSVRMLRALNRKIWIKHFVSIFPADWRLQEERVRLPEGPGQLHHEGVRQAGPEEGRTLWLICETSLTSARKKGIIKANIDWIYLPRPPSYHEIHSC